jgi:hypothetical protein
VSFIYAVASLPLPTRKSSAAISASAPRWWAICHSTIASHSRGVQLRSPESAIDTSDFAQPAILAISEDAPGVARIKAFTDLGTRRIVLVLLCM